MSNSILERFPVLQKIPFEKFPQHICIIPDGNGRWAQEKGKFITEGHRKGFHVAEELLEDLSQISQLKAVTFWGFSANNWKRSKREVDGLMRIFSYLVKRTLNKLMERNGRFIHLGRKDRIPKNLANELSSGENDTKNNTGQIVAIAIDFGGEDQNIRLLEKARELDKTKSITQDLLWELRDGKGVVKSADLLIRTSDEMRTSDIGWLNGATTELYFEPKFFPDVTTSDIIDAIIDFSKRERRMGARK